MQAPKVASKQYETDTDNNTDNEAPTANQQFADPANPLNLPDEAMPLGYKRENLDLNNILKQFGVGSLNKFMGMPSSSEDEAGKKTSRFLNQKEEKKAEEPAKVAPPKQGNV